MATFGWKLADDSGNPVPEQNWNTPTSWFDYPIADPPVFGPTPGAGDSAFIIAGSANLFGGLFNLDFPVTVDVTDSRTVATLGLGGMLVTSLTPTFGTPTTLPTVDINGGSLHVTGSIMDSFTGTLSVNVAPFGQQTFVGTFSNGGTIELDGKGTLEVGGTVGAGITVDFTDNKADLLRLDGVNNTTPTAFAGVIKGFTEGNSILLPTLPALSVVSETYNAGVLTVTDSKLGTLATLKISGAYTSGNFGLIKGTNSVTITEAPLPPAPSTPDLTAASDSGSSNSDNITNKTSLTFTGTAPAGTTVTLLDAGTVLTTAKADAVTGAWTITPSTKFSGGVHKITATETDGTGHTSLASTALTVTVDTTAPAVPGVPDLSTASDSGISNTDNITKVAQPTFTGSAEAGATVTLLDGNTVTGSGVATGGAWSIKASTLATGVHSISATATDVAGNISTKSAALALIVDTTAPAAPSAPDLNAKSDDGVSSTDNTTSITKPEFDGTAEKGAAVTLLDGGKSIGTTTADGTTGLWSITPGTALALGKHTITATATDPAGNVGAPSSGLSVSIVAPAVTHDVHWISGNGDFNVKTNWNPQRVPLAADNAIIDAAGTYAVGLAASDTVKTLAMAAHTTLSLTTAAVLTVSGGSGTVGLAGTINVEDTSVLATTGTIANTGTINLNASTALTELQIIGPSLTLNGKGHVNLSNNIGNQIVGTVPANKLINVDNIIAGAGNIGASALVLTNQAAGVINANQTTSLTLDTGINVITNTGTLESTNSGGLVLLSVVDDSGGGTIVAAGAGAIVDLANTVIGGTLATSAGGVIQTQGGAATLDGQPLHQVNNTGHVVVADSTTLTLLGSIKNSGTISLNGSVGTTNLMIGSPVFNLNGGGAIVLSNSGVNQILGAAPANTLNNIDNKISGAGQLGAGQLTVLNSGIINANQTTALVLNTGFAIVGNSGTIEATNTGGLFIQNTTIDNAGGTIQAINAGAHVDLGTATILGGKLHSASGGVIDTVGGGTIDGLSDGAVTSDATILVKDGENLTLLGTIANSGTISEQASASSSSIHIGSSIVTLQGGGKVTLSNNQGNYILGSVAGARLVNVNNTISGAGQIGVGQMRLTNQANGVINANQVATKTNPASLTLNTGASAIVNAGLLEATNTGGLVIQSVVNNTGGTVAAAGKGAHVDLANGTIQGGTLTSSGGGIIDVGSGNATLDGLSAGTLNTSGTVVVGDGFGLTLVGTINNTGTIQENASLATTTVSMNNPFVTLMGNGALVMSNNVNNQIVGGPLPGTLVNVDNVISGAGQIGGSQLALTNQAKGIINANQTLALVLNSFGNDYLNAGLLESTNTVAGNGGLVLQNTAIDNAGGTIQATGANSHVDLSGGTIIGGTLVTGGGGVIQTFGSGTLDGQTDGVLNNTGTMRVSDSTVLTLLGTISNAGTVAVNATGANNTDIQVASPVVTLTGGGTVTLSNNVNNRIYGVAATNRLVNLDNTIAGGGQIGAGQMAMTNGGTINASAAQSLTLSFGTQAANNTAKGLMEGTGAGGLIIASGIITNSGTVEATNGSKVTYQSGVIDTNITAGVLTGGTWEAVASGKGATISVTGGPVSVAAATIILSGAGSVFRAGDGNTFTNLEQSLTSIAASGTMEVLANRAYTSTKSMLDNGTLQLGGGAFSVNTLTTGAGAHVVGFGSIATTSKTLANAGTIEAKGGTLSVTAAISGTGALQADIGATLTLGAAANQSATVLNNGTVAISAGGSLNVTGSVSIASTGVFQLNAASLLEVAADTGSANKMSFIGSAELVIDQASKFGTNVGLANYAGPLIQNFSTVDSIELKDVIPTSLSFTYNTTSGLLEVSSGATKVSSLLFDKNSLGAGPFHVGDDGSGHTLITRG